MTLNQKQFFAILPGLQKSRPFLYNDFLSRLATRIIEGELSMRYYVLHLAVLIFAIADFPAAAQSDGEIVITAPTGLNDAQKRAWESIEADYQEYVSRLEKLRVEAADDVDDVAEASRNLQSAQRKLKSEQRDMDRTKKDIVKVERAMKKLEQRRANLRATAIRASDRK